MAWTITARDLAKMVEHLPDMDLYTDYTKTELDEGLAEVMRLMTGDQMLIEDVAAFLNCEQESRLPACLQHMKPHLVEWRAFLSAKPKKKEPVPFRVVR